MKTNFLFVLALFMGLAASSQMSQSYIGFVGNFTYKFDNEFRKGTINLPKILNKRSGGNSGTLLLEVWLTKSRYSGALNINGYKLFSKKLDVLKAGWAYNNLKYDFDWEMTPPTGTYYVTFMLSEYDPRGKIDYALTDYLCFTQPFEVKPKIDYDDFWDDL